MSKKREVNPELKGTSIDSNPKEEKIKDIKAEKEVNLPSKYDLGAEKIGKITKILSKTIENLEKDVKNIENQSNKVISKHYSLINTEYQNKKDIVNEFIVLSFNELKNTAESNFSVIKNQIESIHSLEIKSLEKVQNEINQYFNELKDNFRNIYTKALKNIKDATLSYKKSKDKNIDLLMEYIEKNKDIHQIYTVSQLTKMFETFIKELSKKSVSVNDEVNEKAKIESENINAFLNKYESSSTAKLNNFMNSYEKRIETLNLDVNNALKDIKNDSNKIIDDGNSSMKNAFRDEAKGQNSIIDDVYHHISSGLDNYEKQLMDDMDFSKKSIGKFQKDIENIKKDLAKIKNEELSSHIAKLIGFIDEINEKSNNFSSKTNESNGLLLKQIVNQKSFLKISIDKSTEKITRKSQEIVDNLNKKQDQVKNEFNSKLDSISSSSKLGDILTKQVSFFKDFIQAFSTMVKNLKEKQKNVVENSLKRVLGINKDSFYNLEKMIYDDVVTFSEIIKHKEKKTAEEIKEYALKIVSESEDLPTPNFNEFNKSLGKIVDFFDESILKIKAKYQSNFEKRYGEMYNSMEEITEQINSVLELHSQDQEKLFDEINSQQLESFSRLKMVLDAHLKEFGERIGLDIESLVSASQEIVGRIMIKSAQTGYEFNNISDESLDMGKQIIGGFLSDLKTRILGFSSELIQQKEEIQEFSNN